MKISAPKSICDVPVELPASKSISNRLLIIQALSESGYISNLSEAEDTLILKKILDKNPPTYDVGHAGTAFRFLTAFLATKVGTHVLTGSGRMRRRPIAPLVNALRALGGDIQYLEKEGFPPLKINGKKLVGGVVEVESSISSQFISALMLIGPKLEKGLEITVLGEMVSKPYIEMTASLMRTCGADVAVSSKKIIMPKGNYEFGEIEVEYDWSATSFWYELVAVSKMPHLLLSKIKEKSIQGDSRIVALFKLFGVESKFDKEGLHLSYSNKEIESPRLLDFKETPDIVQPFLAMIAAKKYNMVLSGTGNLKYKETDRLEAMKTELLKLGAVLNVANDSALLIKGIDNVLNSTVSISTYQDHRMAMSFAPLAMIYGEIEIENPEVVVKSYPDYWIQLQKLGFQLKL